MREQLGAEPIEDLSKNPLGDERFEVGIHELGGPEILRIEEVEVPPPGLNLELKPSVVGSASAMRTEFTGCVSRMRRTSVGSTSSRAGCRKTCMGWPGSSPRR